LYTRTGTGLLAGRNEAMQASIKRLQQKIDSEDVRINRYADQLRKQFTNMDTQVAGQNALSTYLAKLG
jgi:flagellar capping protein FliD